MSTTSERRGADNRVRDVIIVGGGIAGLTAAWQLRDLDIELFEADERLGGRVKSVRSGDYWVNVGAQMFPGDETRIGQIALDLGITAIPIGGVTHGAALRGRVAAPRQMEMLALVLPLTLRERIAFATSGLKLLRGVKRYQHVATRRSGESDEAQRARILQFEDDRSFADYLGPLPGAVDGIFRNIARRAVAETEELTAGAGLALFSDVLGKKNSAHTFLRAVRGGTARIPEAIAEQLGDRLVVNAPVRSVETRGDIVNVIVERDGIAQEVRARQVLVATQAPIANNILRHDDAELKRALERIHYGGFLSMAIFTNETGPQPWDGLYGAVTPGLSFDFLFNHANPLRVSERRPGGALMVFAGGPRSNQMMDEYDDAEIARRYLADLYNVFPQIRGHVTETHVQRWPLGNIVATPGRASVQAALERGVPGGRIQLAGDYFAHLGGMEPAVRTADAAAKRIRMALSHA